MMQQVNITETEIVLDTKDASNSTDINQVPCPEIIAKGLEKRFGQLRAVDGVDLEIPAGELFSLLGPNGAGKSTTIRMLTTLLVPDAGEATIAGLDLRKQRAEIRRKIGVCPQDVVVAELLTPEENVAFVAESHGIPRKEAMRRAVALLEQFGIAGRKTAAKNLSGGMKRRLNLAMALVHEPEIIFLDEPSAGLDPQARRVVWDFIRDLKGKDSTIILTTHDMEEADALSDHIAILDSGKVIASGTPLELKEKFGIGDVLEIQFAGHDAAEAAKALLKGNASVSGITDNGNQRLLISVVGGLEAVEALQRAIMTEAGGVRNLNYRQNTLEDVFLQLTGRRLRD